MFMTIFLLLATISVYFYWICEKPKKFPPGPKWLPIIGSFPTLYKLKKKCGYAHLAFQELAKAYGPVVGLKLGKHKFVAISTNELVKKALLTDEFNGRPQGFFFRLRSFGKAKGVLFTEGSIWSQHRRFTLRRLKEFGLGQDTMVQQVEFEASNFINFLGEQSKKGPVAMHTVFDLPVLNSLWQMFAGRRFEYDDAKVKEILDVVHDVFRTNDTMGGIISFMPFLRFIIPELSGYNHLVSTHEKLWGFLDEEIKLHEENLPTSQPRDLIDAFLMEIRDQTHSANREEQSIFDRENLLILCLDLFLAGSKTTTDSLSLIFAFLGRNVNYVKELQSELDDVLGRNCAPTLADVTRLPKIESFLAEAARYLIMAPMGVPHRSTNDVFFEGYEIPKDTIILMNFYSANNDEKVWKDPQEFRPQRFLDENGKLRSNSASIPFGVGKRRCLGEVLARHTLFLFFASILHYYDVSPSPDHPLPELLGYDGFVISPKPYYLKLTPRQTNF
ncbi:methyl farnesoate epoxidase-like [Trichogramma pretiosum]|uniref:methyl farnesoate epoxidase-like n=1 Tax=Trichogramma pretiosum TaxID=7493 RepID=UPI0006C9A006|nr:methyl farnesoate epoxidase-like [Trichogramma pretiosum]